MRVACTVLLGVLAMGACKPEPATRTEEPRKTDPRKTEPRPDALSALVDIGQGYVYPTDLAFDGGNIYVASQSMLYRVPIDGGAVTGVSTDGDYMGLALDATNVYSVRTERLEEGSEVDPPGHLVAIDKATGARRALADMDHGVEVVADESALYVAALRLQATPDNEPMRSALLRVPVTGGSPTILAEQIGHPSDLRLHGSAVYLLDIAGHRILRVPKAGGAATTLATAADAPIGLAIAGDTLYYSDGDLHAVPLEGGPSKTTKRGIRSVLASAGTSLYFVTPEGIATRLDADGTEHRLAHLPGRPLSLAVHGDHLYAALYDAAAFPDRGRVIRVPR